MPCWTRVEKFPNMETCRIWKILNDTQTVELFCLGPVGEKEFLGICKRDNQRFLSWNPSWPPGGGLLLVGRWRRALA
jgi:hypothetical protein